MTNLDWFVLTVYILLIIGMSWAIGRRQKSQDDYYLGGRAMGSWPIALSIVATQVSAISLIGAPAFIALKSGGGLFWLQYEFAIPLAMILVMLILVPIYHRSRSLTIYEYLEKRFGSSTRITLSGIFLLSRGLGSGVALLATSIVTSVCLGWTLEGTILVIGLVAIIYTTFGGIKADIYSDIIQLAVLWFGALVMIFVLWRLLDGEAFSFLTGDSSRLMVFDLKSIGIGEGKTYGFWPMLFGTFFLYLSYYGCDQSQAQRLLATRDARHAQKSLFYNGLLRFPLVLTYCTVGILLIPFIRTHPDFAVQLAGQKPDFLVPTFLISYMPKGLLGVFVAGIFAASMSSLDSALNSLSAATYKDFLAKFFPSLKKLSGKQQVRASRILTVLWGMIATGFALRMVSGSETVVELVNKIGSAFYGPILAVFLLGILTHRASQKGALIGLTFGVGVNLVLWTGFEAQISWLWWNIIGFISAFGTGYLLSFSRVRRTVDAQTDVIRIADIKAQMGKGSFYVILGAAFVLMILVSILLQTWIQKGLFSP